MVADEVAYLGRLAGKLLADYAAAEPAQRTPLSFAEIDRIWAELIEPRLDGFASMQAFFEGQTEPPDPASRWRLNWPVPTFSRR
jgi:hypothetical protein